MQAAAREADKPSRLRPDQQVPPTVDHAALHAAGWEIHGKDSDIDRAGWHHPRYGWVWSEQNLQDRHWGRAVGSGPHLWYALPNGMLSVAQRGPFKTIEAAMRALETGGRAA